MATRDEWNEKADDYDRRASLTDDPAITDRYRRKADACRHNACYGTDEGGVGDDVEDCPPSAV